MDKNKLKAWHTYWVGSEEIDEEIIKKEVSKGIMDEIMSGVHWLKYYETPIPPKFNVKFNCTTIFHVHVNLEDGIVEINNKPVPTSDYEAYYGATYYANNKISKSFSLSEPESIDEMTNWINNNWMVLALQAMDRKITEYVQAINNKEREKQTYTNDSNSGGPIIDPGTWTISIHKNNLNGDPNE